MCSFSLMPAGRRRSERGGSAASRPVPRASIAFPQPIAKLPVSASAQQVEPRMSHVLDLLSVASKYRTRASEAAHHDMAASFAKSATRLEDQVERILEDCIAGALQAAEGFGYAGPPFPIRTDKGS